jgi:hypothetical protein
MTTYSVWYHDVARDPYRTTGYDAVCAFFAAENPLNPQEILGRVTTEADATRVFVTLGSNDLIEVYHRIQRQSATIGTAASAFDDRNFATLNDVNVLGATTVEVLPNFLATTAVLPSVRTADELDAGFAALPTDRQLAAAAVGAANTADVTTRMAMYVPPRYAALVLVAVSLPNFTPRALWEIVVRPLRADNLEASCASFVDWCRAAASHGVGAANPLRQLAPPVLVHPDAVLTGHRSNLLRADLPLRFGLAADLGQVVQAIGGLRTDQAAHNAERTRRAEAEKLPSKRWGIQLSQLLSFCNVEFEENLPPVWKSMAQDGVKLDRSTIQYHLNSRTRGPNSFSSRAPTCSPDLAKELGNLNFAAASSDLVEMGISIFVISHPDQASEALASEMAGHYDGQMNGTAGLSLQDSITLKAAQRLQLPTSFLQLSWIIQSYHTLLQVVMGDHHRVVAALAEFLLRWQTMDRTLNDFVNANPLKNSSAIMRSIQLLVHFWAEEQSKFSEPVAAPNFVDILQRIALHAWIPPSMPNTFRPPPAPRPPSLPAPRNSTPPRSPFVPSPTRPADLLYFKVPAHSLDSKVKVRARFDVPAHIRAHGTPPLNDAGGSMCLSFHVRGSCRHDCDRASAVGAKDDHKRHSESETQRLVAFLNLAGPTTAQGNN